MNFFYRNLLVFFYLFLYNTSFAQYNGGDGDGSVLDTANYSTCSQTPLSYYAYFGGNGDGASLDTANYNTCSQTPLSYYAYFGGSGDGASLDTANYNTCSQTPLAYYAYFGGNGDGESLDTANYSTCSQTPLAYYVYFGGNGDGYALEERVDICPFVKPVANFSANHTSVCIGDSVHFTNLSTYSPNTLSWLFEGGMPGTSTSIQPHVQYNTPGFYEVTLIATNNMGVDTLIKTTYITANALPTAAITANGTTTFCQGDSVSLTANSGTSYLWSNGASTQSITTFSSGNYSVKISNSNGCSATSSATAVTVIPLPTAIITPGGATTICQGNSVTLTASADTSYLWSNGATTQSITVFTSENDSVTVTNANGCSATSSPIRVTVISNPSVPNITANGATTFCQGNFVTLTASSANSYLWSTGATTQSITVSSSGNYSVTVYNSNGCSAASAPTLVTVNSNPATPVITASGALWFCIGDSVTLTASPENSYLWSTGTTIQSISVSSSGDYSVTVTNVNGCSSFSSITAVSVKLVPDVPTISGNTSLCFGDSTLLGVTSPCLGCGYNWSNGGIGENISISTTGTYSAIASNACGASNASNSLSVTVNPLPITPIITANGTTLSSGSSIGNQWYLNGNSISGATSQTYTVNQNGNYTVTVIDANGCSATSTPYNFITTGIENIENTNNVLIIPNPNNGIFRIEMGDLQGATINIFNSIGEIIYQSEIENPKLAIDLKDQPNGIYFVHISGENGSSIKKLVINK